MAEFMEFLFSTGKKGVNWSQALNDEDVDNSHDKTIYYCSMSHFYR